MLNNANEVNAGSNSKTFPVAVVLPTESRYQYVYVLLWYSLISAIPPALSDIVQSIDR
jgi:hypothetical protein